MDASRDLTHEESIDRAIRDLGRAEPTLANMFRDVLARQRLFIRRFDAIEKTLGELQEAVRGLQKRLPQKSG
jgi:hypothetical protein